MRTYAEKLRDPRWQKKRLEILQRDNWQCTKCSDSKSNLQVDHIYYQGYRDPWDYPTSALQTLCENCHSWATSLRKGRIKVINAWLVFRRGPVDEFDPEMFSEVAADDKLFEEAQAEFLMCCDEEEPKLRQPPLRGKCGGKVFYVFKLDNNGTIYLCAHGGEEAVIMEMLQYPKCHWQFCDEEGPWTHVEPR